MNINLLSKKAKLIKRTYKEGYITARNGDDYGFSDAWERSGAKMDHDALLKKIAKLSLKHRIK
jgi:hypothetical protein